MAWQNRYWVPGFEDKIIDAFIRYYPWLQVQGQGYRKPTSVWGRIASELYSNTLRFRKWIYTFWREDRRELRTKTLEQMCNVCQEPEKKQQPIQFEIYTATGRAEEEMSASCLSHFWHTIRDSICDNQACPKKKQQTQSSKIVQSLSEAKKQQETLNAFHEPSSLPCCVTFEDRTLTGNEVHAQWTSFHSTRSSAKICFGECHLSGRPFVNETPSMLPINVVVKRPCRNTGGFDSRNFPAEISVQGIKYNVVGIAYATRCQFVCFHKLGNDGCWRLYNGLKGLQSPGHGNREATEVAFDDILKAQPYPNHILAVRPSGI